jgi:hypothetical protein
MTKRAITPRSLLTEAHVQQTVTQFLELDGWRAFKMEAFSDHSLAKRIMAKLNKIAALHSFMGVIAGVVTSCCRAAGVGEPGMPDYLYIRYAWIGCNKSGQFEGWHREDAQVLWIEFKKPGEKPRPDQLAWHEAERARGALVLVVNDIDAFRVWYRDSGLKRR